MKKIAIAVIAILMGTATASAGGPFFKFGAKFGVNIENQNVTLKQATESWESVKDALNDTSTGYHAGITLRLNIPLIPVFIQGEGLYNWNKIKVAGGSSVNVNYFNAPVLVGVGIGIEKVKLRVNVGPVFNFKTNVKLKGLNIEEMGNVLGDALRKPSVTWTAGLGVDLFGLMIDARYNGQFKTNEVRFNNALSTIDTKPSSWSVSVGFLF